MNLHTLLVESAKAEGFPLAGTVDLDLAFAEQGPGFIHEHISHYDHWVEQGFAGSMDYLVRGKERRSHPKLVFPEAQSILSVALPYRKAPAGAPTPQQGPRYARYLEGEDYHLKIPKMLEKVMQTVQSRWEGPALRWKICVDTSAVLERAWAYLAGLGWIGKNTLLINPKYGSYLFLAEVLISEKTGQKPSPLPNYCGKCSRCLNACPTKALGPERSLNSNRCISYWTLEKRGDLEISDDDKKKIGPWIAGCDICQEVCPFNLKPVRTAKLATGPFPSNPTPATITDAIALTQWEDLFKESESEYRQRVKNSALNRVKPAQFQRNLKIAFENIHNNDKPDKKNCPL